MNEKIKIMFLNVLELSQETVNLTLQMLTSEQTPQEKENILASIVQTQRHLKQALQELREWNPAELTPCA